MTLDSPINLSMLDSLNQDPSINVYDNLVLNTTLDVGTIGGSSVSATLAFGAGGQLSDLAETITGTGTIVMGGNAANDLYMNLRRMTIGQNITIEGQSGTIGYTAAILNEGQILANVGSGTLSVVFGAPNNGYSSINQGTVAASSGDSLTITGGGTTPSTSFTNSGPISISGGGTLSINYNNNLALWSNTNTISVTSSTLVVGGTFTQAGLGTLNLSSATTYLSGIISSGGLALSSSTGFLVSQGRDDRWRHRQHHERNRADRDNYNNTFTGVTLDGTLDLTQIGNATAAIQAA